MPESPRAKKVTKITLVILTDPEPGMGGAAVAAMAMCASEGMARKTAVGSLVRN